MDIDSPVNPAASPGPEASGAGGTVSVVEGSTFAISDLAGDILPGGAHGFFGSGNLVVAAGLPWFT